MPLPPAQPRRLLHTRHAHYEGFEREDGLFDIEASLLDTKTFAFEVPGERTWEPGDAVHRMFIRLTVDLQLTVRDIEVAMDDRPHPECVGAQAPMRRVIGCSLRRGWRQAIEERLGKLQGCAHLRELLFNMGTAAFQTLARKLNEGQQQAGLPPAAMGGCLAWDPSGPMVARIYPQFHINPAAPEGPP